MSKPMLINNYYGPMPAERISMAELMANKKALELELDRRISPLKRSTQLIAVVLMIGLSKSHIEALLQQQAWALMLGVLTVLVFKALAIWTLIYTLLLELPLARYDNRHLFRDVRLDHEYYAVKGSTTRDGAHRCCYCASTRLTGTKPAKLTQRWMGWMHQHCSHCGQYLWTKIDKR